MAFSTPTLTTERFLIRPIEDSDLHHVFKGLSHPDVIKYYGVSYQSLESTEEQMEFYRKLVETETGMYWAICSRDNGIVYGVGGFNNLSHAHRKAEVGFWLFPEFWGQGIMNETMPTICNYAFEELKLHRIEGFIESDNQSCINSIERLGFNYEGTMKECEMKNGKFIDLAIYALFSK